MPFRWYLIHCLSTLLTNYWLRKIGLLKVLEFKQAIFAAKSPFSKAQICKDYNLWTVCSRKLSLNVIHVTDLSAQLEKQRDSSSTQEKHPEKVCMSSKNNILTVHCYLW